MKRSKETLLKLEAFVKQVRGLDYQLDFEKLIRKTCENDIKNIDKNKTFFCSELVASCYKVLDIFPE
jgi:protein associated with RNAse G/E